MFELLGDPSDKAVAEAKTVMDIETALAKGALDRAARREPSKVYHKMTVKSWRRLTRNLAGMCIWWASVRHRRKR